MVLLNFALNKMRHLNLVVRGWFRLDLGLLFIVSVIMVIFRLISGDTSTNAATSYTRVH